MLLFKGGSSALGKERTNCRGRWRPSPPWRTTTIVSFPMERAVSRWEPSVLQTKLLSTHFLETLKMCDKLLQHSALYGVTITVTTLQPADNIAPSLQFGPIKKLWKKYCTSYHSILDDSILISVIYNQGAAIIKTGDAPSLFLAKLLNQLWHSQVFCELPLGHFVLTTFAGHLVIVLAHKTFWFMFVCGQSDWSAAFRKTSKKRVVFFYTLDCLCLDTIDKLL